MSINRVIGPRISGKTTALIKKSAETGATIITRNEQSKEYLIRAAGIKHIPEPRTVSDILSGKYCLEKAIVDDAEYVLAQILSHFNVNGVSDISICIEEDHYELLQYKNKEEKTE